MHELQATEGAPSRPDQSKLWDPDNVAHRHVLSPSKKAGGDTAQGTRAVSSVVSSADAWFIQDLIVVRHQMAARDNLSVATQLS